MASSGKMNTYVIGTIGGTTPNHTFTITNGNTDLGDQEITTIAMTGTDQLTLTMADNIASRLYYIRFGVLEFSGNQRHVAVDALEDGINGVYVATVEGLTAWMDDGPKTSMTLNFDIWDSNA